MALHSKPFRTVAPLTFSAVTPDKSSLFPVSIHLLLFDFAHDCKVPGSKGSICLLHHRELEESPTFSA